MKTIDTRNASMSELVAFYNANSGKPAIKKFSDKQTAIIRVLTLQDNMAAEASRAFRAAQSEAIQPEAAEPEAAVQIEAQPEAEPEVKEPEMSEVQTEPEAAVQIEAQPAEAGAQIDLDHTCPFCGSHEVTADGEEGTTGGEERRYCHSCDKSYWLENGKEYKSKQKRAANISAAVSASWANAETRAKRTERHFVTVSVDGDAPVQFSSTKQGWMAFGLPVGRHIAFRAKMKAAGAEGLTYEFNGKKYHFTAFEAEKAAPKAKAKAEPKLDENGNPIVSKRGRPAGSKNKPKDGAVSNPDAGVVPLGSPEDVDVEEV